MCPLLGQLKIGFFSSFSDAAVYSTNEANKAGLKQSIIFRCLCLYHLSRLQEVVVPLATEKIMAPHSAAKQNKNKTISMA
jgi:hypothetical protein